MHALCKELGQWIFQPECHVSDELFDEEWGRSVSAAVRTRSGSSTTDTVTSREQLATGSLVSGHGSFGASAAELPRSGSGQKLIYAKPPRQGTSRAAGLPLATGHTLKSRSATFNQNVRAYTLLACSVCCLCVTAVGKCGAVYSWTRKPEKQGNP